jgi:hypothetical protein
MAVIKYLETSSYKETAVFAIIVDIFVCLSSLVCVVVYATAYSCAVDVCVAVSLQQLDIKTLDDGNFRLKHVAKKTFK